MHVVLIIKNKQYFKFKVITMDFILILFHRDFCKQVHIFGDSWRYYNNEYLNFQYQSYVTVSQYTTPKQKFELWCYICILYKTYIFGILGNVTSLMCIFNISKPEFLKKKFKKVFYNTRIFSYILIRNHRKGQFQNK